jgi:hypothetical protein
MSMTPTERTAFLMVECPQWPLWEKLAAARERIYHLEAYLKGASPCDICDRTIYTKRTCETCEYIKAYREILKGGDNAST